MEKCFNGYAPKRIKTARIQRLLRANELLARARVRVIAILALVFLALIGLAVLFVTNGSFQERKSLLIAMFIVFWVLVVFAVVFFVIGRVLYGGKPDSARIENLLCRYLRGLLGDTYRMYQNEIMGRDKDRLIMRFALEHITDFQLLQGERERLLAADALESEAEKIRRRYEDFITFVISGAREADRYILLRRNMTKIVEKWKHHNYSNYAKPQREIIEKNICRLTRSVTEQYEHFLTHLGLREYIILMNDVIYHDITEDRSLWKPLPTKKKYKAFGTTVRMIENADPGKMIGIGHGGDLFNYAAALNNYRLFSETYATEGCPALEHDIEEHQRSYDAALRAREYCWSCGEKYNPRHRKYREKCRHYVCERCDVCYCESPDSKKRRKWRNL